MWEGWALCSRTSEDPDENMGTSNLCHLLQTLSPGRQSRTSHFHTKLNPRLKSSLLQGFAISVSLLPAGSSVGTAAVPEGHF